jgi:hypothetical protein
MLRKARRELARIESEASIDHIYNFFVTAYHVVDYLKDANCAPAEALKTLRDDYLFQRCADVCNKAKHVRLTRSRPDITPVRWSGALNGAPLGALPLNGGEERWILWPQDNTQIEVKSFARATVAKLEDFFTEHNIPL